MNIAILRGYLGKNPESSTSSTGMVNTRFSIAVNEKWTDQASGEIKERTDWFYISTFGKLAEICKEHLAKGREVTVEGKFRVDEKEASDGTKHRLLSVLASKVHFGARPKVESRPQDEVDETPPGADDGPDDPALAPF